MKRIFLILFLLCHSFLSVSMDSLKKESTQKVILVYPPKDQDIPSLFSYTTYTFSIDKSTYKVVRHVGQSTIYSAFDHNEKCLMPREIPLGFKDHKDLFESIENHWLQSNKSKPFDFQEPSSLSNNNNYD